MTAQELHTVLANAIYFSSDPVEIELARRNLVDFYLDQPEVEHGYDYRRAAEWWRSLSSEMLLKLRTRHAKLNK